MNTYHDRYARFGAFGGILVGVLFLIILGLISHFSGLLDSFLAPEAVPYTQVEVQPMDTYELSENGYIGWGNENYDWRNQFFNFSHDDIQITGQVRDDYIEIFIRDTRTGVMARIAGDNVSSLEMEMK